MTNIITTRKENATHRQNWNNTNEQHGKNKQTNNTNKMETRTNNEDKHTWIKEEHL